MAFPAHITPIWESHVFSGPHYAGDDPDDDFLCRMQYGVSGPGLSLILEIFNRLSGRQFYLLTIPLGLIPAGPVPKSLPDLEAAVSERLKAHPIMGRLPSTQELLLKALEWASPIEVARLAARCLAVMPLAAALARAAADPPPELGQVARAGLLSMLSRTREVDGVKWPWLRQVINPFPRLTVSDSVRSSQSDAEEEGKNFDKRVRQQLKGCQTQVRTLLALEPAKGALDFLPHPPEMYRKEVTFSSYDPVWCSLLSLAGKPLSETHSLLTQAADDAWRLDPRKSAPQSAQAEKRALGVVIAVAASDLDPEGLARRRRSLYESDERERKRGQEAYEALSREALAARAARKKEAAANRPPSLPLGQRIWRVWNALIVFFYDHWVVILLWTMVVASVASLVGAIWYLWEHA